MKIGHRATPLVTAALLAAAGPVLAFTFSFPFPGSSGRNGQPPGPPPGPQGWQFRPQEPTNARGMPPVYQPPPAQINSQMPGQMPGRFPGQMPGQMPGYQPGWPAQYGTSYRQQPQQPARPPRIELSVDERQPYVQENVLLHLRVISERNLETATPKLPGTNDVLLQRVQGPTARSRTNRDGRREIVNEFVYTVTPLRAGDVTLPAITVNGTMAGEAYGYGQASPSQRFEAVSDDPIELQVRPAMAAVRPWLPLKDLSLTATLDGGEEVEEGQPVTLVLELNALGASGAQLPSLEPFLRSPDFRVYREQTLTEGKVSAVGRRLEGRRTEYYTLVPRSGGKLQLPEIRLSWWNVETGTREYAGLPIRTPKVEGESGPFGLSASASAAGGGGGAWFWLPLAGLMLLLLGYWAGVWYRGRTPRPEGTPGLARRLADGMRDAGTRAGAAAAELARRVNPAPLLAGIKPRLTRTLPPSTRFLMCVRAADREQDPGAWYDRFQEMTCRHLQFESQTPLPGITGRILTLRPGADREQIERLMQQLDAALYGGRDIDFPRWKKQFRREVGRGRGLLRGRAGRGPRFRRPLLPELNPRGA